MIENRLQWVAVPGSRQLWGGPKQPSARVGLWLGTVLVLLLMGGCSAEAADVEQIFPLMPAALSDSPPPGIKVLIATDRARLFGDPSTLGATGEFADQSTARQTAGTSITPPDVIGLGERLDAEIAFGDLLQELPASTTSASPMLTVKNRSVNIRSGPGLEYSVVGSAREGTTFEVLGRSTDGGWWHICCISGQGASGGQAEQRAWISNIVVTLNEAARAQPGLGPIFPEDLEAQWDVRYACGSERCEVSKCSAIITADVRNADDSRWLEIERMVTWDDACGENSSWLHQIERSDGTERYASTPGLFVFNFWAGVNPGPLNGLFALGEDVYVRTWCGAEHELELEEGDGWSAIYNGVACHDVRTGMLVSMKYTKRWLFTGTYEGEQYDRAYFGDIEVYEVRLDYTNVDLAYVGPPESEPLTLDAGHGETRGEQ